MAARRHFVLRLTFAFKADHNYKAIGDYIRQLALLAS